MSHWYDRIVGALEAQGFKHLTLSAGDGRLLITEHGSRVLACELPGIEGNLFFHPPFMEDATTRKGVAGGDRLWIAPEVGWFWPSLDEARQTPKESARTPGSIDPGYYGITEQDAGRVVMDNRVDVTDVRDGKRLGMYVTREFRLIEAPDQSAESGDLSRISFAITQSVTWADQTSDEGAVVGCWDILQVPGTPDHPGTLICPTTRRVEPTSYYDPFGDRHVAVDNDRVRFLIDGDRRIKMGIPADATTGRMAYYRQHDLTSSLIVRVFAALPGEPYCDIPRDAPDEQRLGGDALQAYNDDATAFEGTTFGEMEYHDPCLIAGKAPFKRTGTSVTHVLTGPDDAIKRTGRELLGVEIEAIS